MAFVTSYSFLDTNFTLTGPGISVNIGGPGSAASEGGITVTPDGTKNVVHKGADGSALHNLIGSRVAKVTVSLLRSSPFNALLQQAFNFQTLSGATHGRMHGSITNWAIGDTHELEGVAFAKSPDDAYKTESSEVVWEFDVGSVVSVRGYIP